MSLSPKGTDNQLAFFSASQSWDRSTLVRFGLALSFALGLFLFLHFSNMPTEMLNLNTPTPNYIVAQTDFTFKDDEASCLAKEEAVKDCDFIRSVSEIDCANKLSLYKAQIDRSLYSRNEQEDIKKISDTLIRELRRVVFTSEKTRDLMKRHDMAVDHCIVWHNGKDDAIEVLPRFIWDEVARMSIINNYANSRVSKAAEGAALDAFSILRWQIEIDAHHQTQLRRRVSDVIAPVNRNVRGGTIIIDKGEIVTQRHQDMMAAMQVALKGQRSLGSWQTLCTLPLVIVAILFGGLYIYAYQKEIYHSNRQLLLVLLICGATFVLAKCTELALLRSPYGYRTLAHYSLLSPFTAIIAASLFPLRAAAFISGYITTVLTWGLPVQSSIFLPINFAGVLIALLNAKRLHKHRDLFFVSLQIWAAASLMTFALDLYKPMGITAWEFSHKVAVHALFVLATAILVVVLLPLIEMVFGIVTEMTLLEYLDPNNELLRRLAVEAPGTYQHSLYVSHLAESAALSINAKALFCRVTSLYHDIGKLAYPNYFVENQKDINVHRLLTPTESANAILGHVTEGIALARAYNLPAPFIQIIKEHHGTGLVNHFYSCQCQLLGSEDRVDQRAFRYKGPIPQSKESLIIMLCDTLEATSRSMDVVDEAKVGEVLDNQISWYVTSGQFNSNIMTLQELHTVRENLVKTLTAANHSRVKYQMQPRALKNRSKNPFDTFGQSAADVPGQRASQLMTYPSL